MSFSDFSRGLRNQIGVLNDLILGTLNDVVQNDPSAVIILMSDHGSRYSLADPSEQFHTFLAARTPGKHEVFADDEAAVNLLRRLFAEYFGAELERLPYRAWLGEWWSYLYVDPFSPNPDPIAQSR